MVKTVVVDFSYLGILCGFGNIAEHYSRRLAESLTDDLHFVFIVPERYLGAYGPHIDYLRREHLRADADAYPQQIDLWHATSQAFTYRRHVRGTQQLLTIHDLNFLYEKKHIHRLKHLLRMQYMVARSDAVTVISNYVKTDLERHVYDLVVRRFISVFYPDCLFATTTVMGKVDSVEFKASGKLIKSPGWRVIYDKDANATADDEAKNEAEEKVLPDFVKGESGPHTPTLTEKWTTPPKYYTEATLLRAMETAGKFVEDEELRAALKENGIGRPSSRAGIIETLYKRRYIRRERKNLIATATGIELIDTIREDLLKSCELTGIWEKKLRDIEHQRYDASMFIDELKQQIKDIVVQVLTDNSNRRITLLSEEELNKKSPKPPRAKKAPATTKQTSTTKQAAGTPTAQAPQNALAGNDHLIGQPCPLCKTGTIIKGKTAYGCSRWKEGCGYRLPFG